MKQVKRTIEPLASFWCIHKSLAPTIKWTIVRLTFRAGSPVNSASNRTTCCCISVTRSFSKEDSDGSVQVEDYILASGFMDSVIVDEVDRDTMVAQTLNLMNVSLVFASLSLKQKEEWRESDSIYHEKSLPIQDIWLL